MKRKNISILLSLCLILSLFFGVLSSANAAKVASGKITFSPSAVNCGDPITMIVIPDPGCALKSISVTDSNGTKVTLTDSGNGSYTFIMPEGGIAVQADFRWLNEGEVVDTKSAFIDVKSDAYYAEAVAWAVEKGITTGTSATTFSPDAFCTRGQVVTFLWRLAGCPEVTSNIAFTDVVYGSYYEKAVKWAVANNITTGTSATTFSPDGICTRAQIVTFLARYAHGTPSSENNPFTDVNSNTYYEKSVLWALENNITTGTTTTSFAPEAYCTRAQVVTFLYRMTK